LLGSENRFGRTLSQLSMPTQIHISDNGSNGYDRLNTAHVRSLTVAEN
jgi:hypothetical protein